MSRLDDALRESRAILMKAGYIACDEEEAALNRDRQRMDGVIWCTCLGNYGDVLAGMGNMLAVMERQKLEQVNVVYIGKWASIPEFLRAQSWIESVRWVQPRDHEQFNRWVGLSCGMRNYRFAMCESILENVPQTAVQMTHIDAYCWGTPQPCRWQGAVLPYRPVTSLFKGLPAGLRILVNPVSVESCTLGDHWVHWLPAVQWLAEYSGDVQFVVIAKDRITDIPRSRNIVDLTGKTNDMLEVWEISRRCDAMITTSNNLSMWSIVENKPSMVVLNRVIGNPHNYFMQWIDNPPNTIYPYATGLAEFKTGVDLLCARAANETAPSGATRMDGDS